MVCLGGLQGPDDRGVMAVAAVLPDPARLLPLLPVETKFRQTSFPSTSRRMPYCMDAAIMHLG
jgi:hypothetical protein